MHVSGDPDACRQTAESLVRAAAEMAHQARVLVRAREAISWLGAGAQAWSASTDTRARSLTDLAARLQQAGGVLRQHATGLAELQRRAAALVAEADAVGLHLQADGWIAHVAVPCTAPAAEVERAQALARQRERERLLRAVARLRDDENVLHLRTRAHLEGYVLEREPLQLAPPSLTAWDAPAAFLGVAGTSVDVAAHPSRAARSASPLMRTLARAKPLARGVPVAGAVYGSAVDIAVDGRSPGDAVARNGFAALAGTGAGAAVVFVGGAASVPAIPVILGAGAAFGVGKLATSVSDAVTGDDRPLRRVRTGRPGLVPRPAPGPAPGGPQRPRSVHRSAAPAPTPRPQPTPSS